jgi:hypothetical protein
VTIASTELRQPYQLAKFIGVAKANGVIKLLLAFI